MSGTLGSQPSALSPASKPVLKPCFRSCKGLMLYFPPRPQQEITAPKSSSAWRSSEPICLGLSAPVTSQTLDLTKLHEIRDIPLGQVVDFSVVIGHAVFQSSNAAQGLPPGCMTGMEVVRFSSVADTANSAAASPTTSTAALNERSILEPSSAATNPKTWSESVASFMSGFRLLTSSADANARINQTWSRISSFDVQQYAQKLQVQAHKNVDGMAKWLRDLQDAVTKPPKT